MRRDKKLLFTVCGVISLISRTSEVKAQTPSQTSGNGTVEDDRPIKGGVPSKAGIIRYQETVTTPKGGSAVESKPTKGGSSDQKPSKGGSANSSISCNWVTSPKIIETNCEGTKKKTCIGDADCTEGKSASFRTEVSCSLGKAGVGVSSCADATVCAESPTGINSESCNVRTYQDNSGSKSGSTYEEPQQRNNSKAGGVR